MHANEVGCNGEGRPVTSEMTNSVENVSPEKDDGKKSSKQIGVEIRFKLLLVFHLPCCSNFFFFLLLCNHQANPGLANRL